MNKFIMYGCVLVLSAWFAGTTQAAMMFEITIENVGTNVLTPVVVVSHSDEVDLFDGGAAVSAEVEALAEDGVVDGLVDLATGLIGSGVADVDVAGAAPILPGESVSVMLEADTDNPLLSFLSMLAVSNDAFIGVTTGDGAINLFNPDDTPIMGSFTVSFLNVWDAGTEVNDGLAAHVPALGAAMGAGVDEGGVLTQPHPGVYAQGDIPADANWYGYDVAKITIVPEPAALMLFVSGMTLVFSRRLSA